VIALLRAKRLAALTQQHAFLAYNRLLIHYCRALAQPVEINADTWIGWFRRLWQDEFNSPVPDHGKPYEIDWPSVARKLASESHCSTRAFLVIDEGQDMPVAFYEALAYIGFKHFFVVADFNQVLFPEQSCNRGQLCDALGIESTSAVELRTNHRNSFSVARLAAHFCALIDDPQSPKPIIPSTRDSNTPILFAYDQLDWRRDLLAVAKRIIALADRNPRWLVAVLCPTNEICQRYQQALQAAAAELDGRLDCGEARIVRLHQDTADFTQGGIGVMTAQSCKGLEFDAVIVADVHWYRDHRSNLQRLYVAVSRAVERVILLRDLAAPFPLDAKFPVDPTLLKRVP
jgi:DNA helicase IV